MKNSNGLSVNARKSYSGLVAATRHNTEFGSIKSTNLALTKRFMSADHSKLWPVEKIVTLGLLGLTPAAIISPNFFLDDTLAILTVAHFHWYNYIYFLFVTLLMSSSFRGLEACVVDYVRPILFGNAVPKVTLGLLYLLSFATLGGLLYYNHTSIGIGQTVKKIWAIQK